MLLASMKLIDEVGVGTEIPWNYCAKQQSMNRAASLELELYYGSMVQDTVLFHPYK